MKWVPGILSANKQLVNDQNIFCGAVCRKGETWKWYVYTPDSREEMTGVYDTLEEAMRMTEIVATLELLGH